MSRIELMGGNVQVYRRGDGKRWHCSASIDGTQHRISSKLERLDQAKAFAEDWYLTLQGKHRAGVLDTGPTFKKTAAQFLKEYGVITDGQRSPKWTEGHELRLRVHLIPFFGDLPINKLTAGKVQEYRVHRMTTYMLPNPHSKGKHKPKTKPPARSTLHNEIVTLSLVLQTAIRHEWLDHLPNLSAPYKSQAKRTHRPWFSPEEYKQLYEAARKYAREDVPDFYRWNAEQVYDFILFMANTGLRPDEAYNLEHRDVRIVEDEHSGDEILEIEVRGKRGVGHGKSMPGAVRVYRRLLARAKPVQEESRRERQLRKKEGGAAPAAPVATFPQPTDKLFPGNHIKLFNNLLERTGLKLDRDGKPRTAYSLRHTYICMRLMEGADIYQIAKNCRTSVEMIEKHYAIHLKHTLDTSAINVMKPKAAKRKKRTTAAASKATSPNDDL